MILFALFILGLAVGSFLNVLIDRLPKDESIMGRSHCDHCRKKLEWMDLIPVFSFLWLDGKCRRCHKKLSWQYPAIELLTGLLFILTWLRFPILPPIQLFCLLGIEASFVVIFFADFKYRIIPDQVQIAAFLFTLLLFFFEGKSWQQIIFSGGEGLILALPLLLINVLTSGRGMGFGDIKLGFVIGFFLGMIRGGLAIYIGFIIGAIMGAFLILQKKRNMKMQIAFGPFLIIGIFIMLYCGDPIVAFVNSFLGFY